MEYRLIVVANEKKEFGPEAVFIQVGEEVEKIQLTNVELYCLIGICQNALDEYRGGK